MNYRYELVVKHVYDTYKHTEMVHMYGINTKRGVAAKAPTLILIYTCTFILALYMRASLPSRVQKQNKIK